MNPIIKRKTLEIELLDNCNLSCELCQRINFPRTKYQLDIEIIKDVIIKNNYERVLLMGTRSEPTMYLKFMELVKWLQDNKIEIELYTNGTKEKQFWKELSKIIIPGFIINWCISGTTKEEHYKYRHSSLSILFENVNCIPEAINFGLFILFEYNTKNYSNPITDSDLIKLNNEISDFFDGVLYIHSGDIHTKNELRTQRIKNLILPSEQNCIGKGINFLGLDEKLYDCKYKFEALQQYGLIPNNICTFCEITFFPKIQDRFIKDSEIIFRKNFNDANVYNIPYFLERKKLDRTNRNRIDIKL